MNEEQVRRLLGAPELQPLVDRVAQRMRRGRPLDGAVSMTLTPAQRTAVSALVGRPLVAAATTSVRLQDVDRVVRESGAAPDLAAAITVLRGRIPVTKEEEAQDRAAWEAAYAVLDAFVEQHPEYKAYPALLRRTGALKAIGRTPEQSAALLTDLVAVLSALPTTGETIAAFAARVLHRAHALDVGALRALADGALIQRFDDIESDPDASREERHVAAWARAGIAFDTLASSVLVHALRFDGRTPVGAALNAITATGQPVLVTLRMLLGGLAPAAVEVFVCENPAVLIAAADRHGAACRPLICVRGQPSGAARHLLRTLVEAGAVIRYHGDFDWGGLQIGNGMMTRFGAVPWRFSAADLETVQLRGAPLAGGRVEAVWAPGLAAAIEARGERLEEEQVLEFLLADLGR